MSIVRLLDVATLCPNADIRLDVLFVLKKRISSLSKNLQPPIVVQLVQQTLSKLIPKCAIIFCALPVPARGFGASFPRPPSTRAHRQLGGQAVGSTGRTRRRSSCSCCCCGSNQLWCIDSNSIVETRIADVSAERSAVAQRNVNVRALKHV